MACDGTEARLIEHFFAGPALERSLVAMCLTAKHDVDPIASVILQVLGSPIQIQLTATGLQPIAGRGLLIEWHTMTVEQREFLLGVVRERERFHVYESAILWRRRGAPRTLDASDVLEAICRRLLASKIHADPRARLAMANILLQRLQASLPLGSPVQAELNRRLFSSAVPRVEAGGGRAVGLELQEAPGATVEDAHACIDDEFE